MQTDVGIHPLSTLRDAERYSPGIDAIFFQSSNTQTFADDGTRRAFRERWLGRYLLHDPQWTYIALASDDEVAGYLVGSVDDPARTPRFSDIPYFQAVKDVTARFPAHLHVNVGAPYRDTGIGSRLIAAFVSAAAAAGASGVHVATSRGAKNVSFYLKNGFAEIAHWGEGPREVVFLGRRL